MLLKYFAFVITTFLSWWEQTNLLERQNETSSVDFRLAKSSVFSSLKMMNALATCRCCLNSYIRWRPLGVFILRVGIRPRVCVFSMWRKRTSSGNLHEWGDTLDYCDQALSGCCLGPETCSSLWGLAGRGNNGSELLLCALALLNQTIRRSDWILILLGPP